MDTLDQWLSPIGADRFFQEIWGRQTWHAPVKDRVPFTLEEFWCLLDYAPVTEAHVDGIRPSGRIASGVFLRPGGVGIRSDVLQGLLDDGVTLRVRGANRWWPALETRASSLRDAFGCPVSVNAYYSRGGDGVAPHFDTHHVFAVQVHGVKEWQTGPVVVQNPRAGVPLAPTSPPPLGAWAEISEGEMLYVPPGLWHTVRTQEESLHLTVGIHPPVWADRLEEALRQAVAAHPLLRAHVPFVIRENRCVYRTDVSSEARKLLALVDRALGQEDQTG